MIPAIKNLVGSKGPTLDFEDFDVPQALLLKLSEEAGELIQAISKGINPNSSQYLSQEAIIQEASDVYMYLVQLNKLVGGKIALKAGGRFLAAQENPKP